MPHKITVALMGLLLLPAGVRAASDRADAPPPTTLSAPDLYYLDHFDVSPPLSDIPAIPPPSRSREGSPANIVPLLPRTEPPKGWVDPLEAASHGGAPGPEVGTVAGLNFEGVQGGAYPPDTNGAVGATQYVQWVNFSFAVYNKSTGALVYGPAAGNTLWSGFGGACESYNSGDPVVSYDKLAGRWVMTQFAFASSTGGPWYQCVAVSTTSSATGTWRRFAYNFTALNDYPKLGVWPDGYYITFNMFSYSAGWTFLGARTCALDRLNMITASNTPGPIQCFQSSAWASLLPADLDGTTAPPTGAPNYQLSLGGSPYLRLYKFQVNWAMPSSSSFTGPTTLTVATYSQAGALPQPGTTVTLASLSDRLMHRLAYRNRGSFETLLATHSVTTGSAAAGVRWYEIRSPNATPSVYQQGTFSPDATSRWMGSIAMDKFGNIAVGYSASSSSVYPGIRYTGRLSTDALGTLQSENTLVAGARSQTNTNRWGDYSSMTVDPVDDCTFWYTTEYLRTGTSTGSTRIASFAFPACRPLSVTITRVGTWNPPQVVYAHASGGVPPYVTYAWYRKPYCSPPPPDPCVLTSNPGVDAVEPCPLTRPEPDDVSCLEWYGPFYTSPPDQWTPYQGPNQRIRVDVRDSAGTTVIAYDPEEF